GAGRVAQRLPAVPDTAVALRARGEAAPVRACAAGVATLAGDHVQAEEGEPAVAPPGDAPAGPRGDPAQLGPAPRVVGPGDGEPVAGGGRRAAPGVTGIRILAPAERLEADEGLGVHGPLRRLGDPPGRGPVPGLAEPRHFLVQVPFRAGARVHGDGAGELDLM